jgi:hypothetical protein
VEAAGIEPAEKINVTDSAASGSENLPPPRAANALHGSGSNCLHLSSLDADLREIVAAWNGIPFNVQEAILVLARLTVHRKE